MNPNSGIELPQENTARLTPQPNRPRPRPRPRIFRFSIARTRTRTRTKRFAQAAETLLNSSTKSAKRGRKRNFSGKISVPFRPSKSARLALCSLYCNTFNSRKLARISWASARTCPRAIPSIFHLPSSLVAALPRCVLSRPTSVFGFRLGYLLWQGTTFPCPSFP